MWGADKAIKWNYFDVFVALRLLGWWSAMSFDRLSSYAHRWFGLNTCTWDGTITDNRAYMQEGMSTNNIRNNSWWCLHTKQTLLTYQLYPPWRDPPNQRPIFFFSFFLSHNIMTEEVMIIVTMMCPRSGMMNYEHDGVDESYNVCLGSCQKCSFWLE